MTAIQSMYRMKSFHLFRFSFVKGGGALFHWTKRFCGSSKPGDRHMLAAAHYFDLTGRPIWGKSKWIWRAADHLRFTQRFCEQCKEGELSGTLVQIFAVQSWATTANDALDVAPLHFRNFTARVEPMKFG